MSTADDENELKDNLTLCKEELSKKNININMEMTKIKILGGEEKSIEIESNRTKFTKWRVLHI